MWKNVGVSIAGLFQNLIGCKFIKLSPNEAKMSCMFKWWSGHAFYCSRLSKYKELNKSDPGVRLNVSCSGMANF